MNDLWTRYFALPVTGNAKLLLLRLALEPFTETPPEPRNVRAFCDELKMFIPEYEKAFLELRDPRIGMMTSHHHDRPQLPKDAWVRQLFSVAPPSIPAPEKPLPKKVK
jgi:hypothetical protein